MAFNKNEYLVQDDITHRYKRISEHTVGDSLTGTVQENKQVFDDYPDLISEKHNQLINNLESVVASSVTETVLKSALLDTFYPVGSYYETSKTTAQFDPNTAWGGTWELESSGQVHVSAGTGYTVGATGGSKDAIIPQHNHTATFSGNQLANHTHAFAGTAVSGHAHGLTTSKVTANSGGSHTHTNSASSSQSTNSGHSHTPSEPSSGFLSYKYSKGGSERKVTTYASSSSSGDRYILAATESGSYGWSSTTDWESAHTHKITTSVTINSGGAHTHSVSGTTDTAGGFTPAGTNSSVTAGTPSGSVTINNTGVSVTNANMQPYIVVNRWHRTA